jgi:hypothetical protein
MSFEMDGFFSSEVETFRQCVRESQPFKAWFDYALDLNRLGFDVLRQVKKALADKRQFAMHAHFVRVHQSFQSALVLAERGLVPDARTVLRSGVESAIAINALAKDPGFVAQMVEAHHRSQRTLARIGLAKFAELFSTEEIGRMNKAISEADALEASKGKELTDTKWEQVADKHCPELYQILYRDLSSDGTHATINSLERFLVVDATGKIVAFKPAPDTSGLVEVLSAASQLFFWAAVPFADANGLSDVSARISEQLQRFATLPGAFRREAVAA